MQCLRDKHTGTPNSLDLLLRELAEELGLHNQRLLGQLTLAKHLVDALSRAWEESISARASTGQAVEGEGGGGGGGGGVGSQCAVNAPTAHQPEDAMHHVRGIHIVPNPVGLHGQAAQTIMGRRALTARTQSMTGALPSGSLAYFVLVCSLTRVQILSKFITGAKNFCWVLWK